MAKRKTSSQVPPVRERFVVDISKEIKLDTNIPLAKDEVGVEVGENRNIINFNIPVTRDEIIRQTDWHGAELLNSNIVIANDDNKVITNKISVPINTDIAIAGDDNRIGVNKQSVPISTDIVITNDDNKVVTNKISIPVNTDITIANDENKIGVSKQSVPINLDITVAKNENVAVIDNPSIPISTDIVVSKDENRFIIDRQQVLIISDIPQAKDEIIPQISSKNTPISTDIAIANDENRIGINRRSSLISSNIPQAKDEIKSTVSNQSNLINSNVLQAKDEVVYEVIDKSNLINSAIQIADDETKIGIIKRSELINSAIPRSRDEIKSSVILPRQDINLNISPAKDEIKPTIIPFRRDISLDIPLAKDEMVRNFIIPQFTPELSLSDDDKIQKIQLGFNGKLIVYDDPLNIGDGNCSDLVNFRYTDFGLEGVDGTSRINSTILSGSPDFISGMQLRTNYTVKSYVLLQGTDDAGSYIFLNTATIPIAGNFSASPIYTEASGAGLGRFAKLPRGAVGFCNSKENILYYGNEMPVSAFLLGVFDTVTIGAGSDVICFESDISTPTNVNVDVANGTYTCDTLAEALDTAMSLMGTFPDTSVVSRMGRTYIDAGTSHWIDLAATVGEEIYYGFIDVTSATSRYLLSEMFQEPAPYFDDDKISDYTSVVKNLLTDSANSVTLLGSAVYGYCLIGASRPLDGINFDVSSGTISSSTVTVKYFDGNKMTSVGSLSGTSDLTFTSTATLAKPLFVKGYYLYFYMVEIVNSTTPTITHITVKPSVYKIRDLWDGVYRNVSKFVYGAYQATGDDLLDYSTAVSVKSYRDDSYTLDIGGMASQTANDYLLVMFDEPIGVIRIDLFEVEVSGGSDYLTVSFWNGTAWVYATSTQITALGSLNKIFTKSGYVSFEIPSGSTEIKKTLHGITGYAYKIEWAGGNLLQTQIDYVVGIPRVRNIDAYYKFPFQYQNRTMLCGCISDNEYNRVDYSMMNTTTVFNGADSSGINNERSIYFGGEEALTCAVELFNIYGSNIYSYALFFKNNEIYMLTGYSPETFTLDKISNTIGCPASLTLVSAEVLFKVGDEFRQNIAIWLSDKGPMIFANNTIVDIGTDGIGEKYFDRGSSDCITSTSFNNARGWYDPNQREYNLIFQNTSGNVWLVYDLIRKKWFRKNATVSFPMGAFVVEDNDGNKYVYGYTNKHMSNDNGYLLRLENGRYWADGSTTIIHDVVTADIMPFKDMWTDSALGMMKIIHNEDDDGNLDISHYGNGNNIETANAYLIGTGENLGPNMANDGYRTKLVTTHPYSILTGIDNPYMITANSHKFLFRVTDTVDARPKLVGWGAEFIRTNEITKHTGDT